MFTLHKLAVLIVIIGALLYGARLVARLNAVRRAVIAGGRPMRLDRRDLVECRVCGVYVTSESRMPCGHADCPQVRSRVRA